MKKLLAAILILGIISCGNKKDEKSVPRLNKRLGVFITKTGARDIGGFFYVNDSTSAYLISDTQRHPQTGKPILDTTGKVMFVNVYQAIKNDSVNFHVEDVEVDSLFQGKWPLKNEKK